MTAEAIVPADAQEEDIILYIVLPLCVAVVKMVKVGVKQCHVQAIAWCSHVSERFKRQSSFLGVKTVDTRWGETLGYRGLLGRTLDCDRRRAWRWTDRQGKQDECWGKHLRYAERCHCLWRVFSLSSWEIVFSSFYTICETNWRNLFYQCLCTYAHNTERKVGAE